MSKPELYVGKLKSRTEINGTDDKIFVNEPDFKGSYMNRMSEYAGKNLIMQKNGDHFTFGVWSLHKDWIENVQPVILADGDVKIDGAFQS